MGTHRQSRKSYWLFGLVAVLIHLSLLVIPLGTRTLPDAPKVLELEIFTLAKPPLNEKTAEAQAPEPEPTPEPAEVVQSLPEVPDQTFDATKTTAIAKTVLRPRDLRRQLESFKFPAPVKPARQLGVPVFTALPDNLSRPVLAWEATVFEEMYAPSETEIIDQWQQADGTTMVVMRTPGGHTLCGRKAPWDPFNPLFEPVPMFHKCGGGGKRTRR